MFVLFERRMKKGKGSSGNKLNSRGFRLTGKKIKEWLSFVCLVIGSTSLKQSFISYNWFTFLREMNLLSVLPIAQNKQVPHEVGLAESRLGFAKFQKIHH